MTDRLSERVLSIERRLADMQANLDAAAARQAMSVSPSSMRIGRISGSPQDSHNTFDVIFDDGSYPQLAGMQTPSYTARQAAARTVVHNLASTKIPANTRVPVWFWSDRWWTWWKEAAETTPSNPAMCGFNDLAAGMTYLTYNENRVANFETEDLIGTISGLEWENDIKAWTVEIGDWYTNWFIQGHSECSLGTTYPTNFKVQYLYGNLQWRDVPSDEDPDPTWEAVPDAKLYSYAAQGGYWNSSSRGLLLRLTDEPRQIRMVCGMGQSSSQACTNGHIYDSHWHWTKAEFG